ncbi:MAG: hypothetical protein MZW92_14760 [Comamonadaceae bacterium]|nr:hypothetical protein [Comamonadaceae bacterium]
MAPERCVAIEHGSPLAGVDAAGMRQGPAGGAVNVAIVGFFGLEKGSRVFLDLVRRMRRRSDVRWFESPATSATSRRTKSGVWRRSRRSARTRARSCPPTSCAATASTSRCSCRRGPRRTCTRCRR